MRGTKLLAVAAVLGTASLVFGQATLTELAPWTDGTTTETSSEARAITPDGRWVGGISGGNRGVIWETQNPGTAINVLGGTMQAEYIRGIAYRTEPAQGRQELVLFGKTSNTTGPTYWFYRPSDATWGPKLRQTDATNDLPGANALASHATRADAVLSTYGKGASNKTVSYKLYGGTDTVAPSLDEEQKSTTEESGTKAIARSGRAVGFRKASTIACNWVADFIDDGPVVGNLQTTYFAGLDGTNAGTAWAISADGSIVCGYSPVSGGRTGNWPYKAVLSPTRTLVSIVELPSLNPAATTNQGLPYGLTADGHWGVGRDYSFGVDRAVLWDLQNPSMPAIDLTALAAQLGILGNFQTGNGLRRAYSIGIDAGGSLCITGLGVNTAGQTRAFLFKLIAIPLGACCATHGFSRTCTPAVPQDQCPAPNVWSLNQGCSAVCSTCGIPWADADFDGDIDQVDYGAFQACFTTGDLGIQPGCECYDRPIPNVDPQQPPTPEDGKINEDDLRQFEKCATAPEILWTSGLTPDCVSGDGEPAP